MWAIWRFRRRLIANDACNGSSSRIVILIWLVVLLFSLESSAVADPPEILGLRLGMTRAEIKDKFSQSGVVATELGSEGVTAPRMPVGLDGVREVRLALEKERVKKIVILFTIPPREPTAANIIGSYEKEKARLTQLFGPPANEVADLQAPRPVDRHEWLARGRGYYRAIWKIPEMIVTLWLYAEDDGLVFQEIYQGQ